MAPKRKDKKQAEEKPDLEAAPKTPDAEKGVKQEPPGTPKTAKRSKAAKDAKTEQPPAKMRRGNGSSVSGSADGKSDVDGAPGKDGSSVKGDESTDPSLKVR